MCAGRFAIDLRQDATICTFVTYGEPVFFQNRHFPLANCLHTDLQYTVPKDSKFVGQVDERQQVFSKSPKVCHFCELQEAALALRTGWRIDGTGHLEGDMKRKQNQRTSVGRHGNTIQSDARPREEAFQFRRLQHGGASLPHAGDAIPIPIHFNPGIQIFLVACSGAS
jgi:hypothetical protein